MSVHEKSDLQSMPVDVSEKIYGYLGATTLGKVATTCRALNMALEMDHIWRDKISPEAKRIADRLAPTNGTDLSQKELVKFLVKNRPLAMEISHIQYNILDSLHLDRSAIASSDNSHIDAVSAAMNHPDMPCNSFAVFGDREQGSRYMSSVKLKDKDGQVRFSYVPYNNRYNLSDPGVVPYIRENFQNLIYFHVEGLSEDFQAKAQRTFNILRLPEQES